MNRVNIYATKGVQQFVTKNNMRTKDTQAISQTQVNEGADTVSFKAKSIKTVKPQIAQKGVKAIFVSIAGFLGFNIAKSAKQTTVETPISDLSPKSQALAKALESEKLFYSGKDHDYEYPAYTREAINAIVQCNEEDPNKAYEFAKIVRGAAYKNIEDYNYVLEQMDVNPKRVDKYTEKGLSFALPQTLKAADIDEVLTDKVSDVYKEGDVILSLVDEIKTTGDKKLEKIATDKRLTGEIKDLKTLAGYEEQDEIDELINIEENYNNKFRGAWRDERIAASNILKALPTYLENPKGYTELRQKGGCLQTAINLAKAQEEHPKELKELQEILKHSPSEIVAKSIDAYVLDPEGYNNLYIEALNYKRSSSLSPNEMDKLNYSVVKRLEHKELIDEIWPRGLHGHLNELCEYLALIDLYPESAKRIVEDGRQSKFKKMIPVYNKYPDREITDRMIELETSSLAKHFDLKV